MKAVGSLPLIIKVSGCLKNVISIANPHGKDVDPKARFELPSSILEAGSLSIISCQLVAVAGHAKW